MDNKKRQLKVLEKQAVSLAYFMRTYLGINDDTLLRETGTHKFLCELFSDLQRESFKYILDNPRSVLRGDVVLVVDQQNNCIPYFVKDLKEKMEEQGLNQVMDFEDWDNESISWNESGNSERDYDLDSLTTYQLLELMYDFKKRKDMEGYNEIKALVREREDNGRENRLSKRKALQKAYKIEDRYEGND